MTTQPDLTNPQWYKNKFESLDSVVQAKASAQKGIFKNIWSATDAIKGFIYSDGNQQEKKMQRQISDLELEEDKLAWAAIEANKSKNQKLSQDPQDAVVHEDSTMQDGIEEKKEDPTLSTGVQAYRVQMTKKN